MRRIASGFTLLELLTVISIIGLLASILFTSLSQARQHAYEATRTQTLVEVRKALELYYATYGHYPAGIAFSAWSAPGRCSSQGYPRDSINWENCASITNPPSYGDPMGDLIRAGFLRDNLPIDYENLDSGPYLGGGYARARSFLYCSGNPHSDCTTIAANCPAIAGDGTTHNNTQTYILGTNLASAVPNDGGYCGNFIFVSEK